MVSLGLVVEGEADYATIPVLLRRAGATPGRASIFRGQGVQCDIPTLVQKRLLAHTRVQLLKGYRKILVIIDREMRQDCPGDLAQRVQAELVGQMEANYGYGGSPPRFGSVRGQDPRELAHSGSARHSEPRVHPEKHHTACRHECRWP